MTTNTPTRVIASEKAGRVLSTVNVNAVRSALDALLDVMKRAGVLDEPAEKAFREYAEKCMGEAMPDADYPMPYRPYGGATSFADVATYEQASELTEEVAELNSQLQVIISNIMSDETLTPPERAASVRAAADEFDKRVGAISLDNPEGEKARSGLGAAPATIRIEKTATAREPIVDTKAIAALDTDIDPGAFTSFKDTKGDLRWIATWTNKFQDRDGEVFPNSAHKEYEAWVDRTHQYPDLHLWHIPGSKCGKADMLAYDEDAGMFMATGTWDPDAHDIARAFMGRKDIGVSHGYHYDPRMHDGRAIWQYRTFEISPLPARRASNLGTAFEAAKEAPMLTKEKKAWLVELIGAEKAENIESRHIAMSKELEAAGIGYKEFVMALVEEPPATATKAADEPKVIFAPGFKSVDDGATWIACTDAEKEAFGGKKAPPFGKDGKPKKDDDEEDDEGKGKGDKAADVPTASGLKEVLGELLEPIRAEIAGFKAWTAGADSRLEALATSDDAKIAAAFKSARAAGAEGLAAARASGANETLVDDAAGEKAREESGWKEDQQTAASPYVNDLVGMLTGARPGVAVGA